MNAKRSLHRSPDTLWRFVACLAFWSSWGSDVQAITVALVHPASTNAELVETVARLRGELSSVNFDVKLIEGGADPGSSETDGPLRVRASSAGAELDAVIEIVGERPPFVVDVWVIGASSGRTRARRVDLGADTQDAPERLSIRAVEVLRSALLESDLAPGEHPPAEALGPAPSSPALDRQEAGAQDAVALGLSAGASTLIGLDGVGPAVLPHARLDVPVGTSLTLQLALAGLGSRPLVTTDAGGATLSQSYALLGARYRFRSKEVLQPFLALSAGALATEVEGRARAPREEHTGSQWSFLVEASAGADLRLSERTYSSFAAHVHVAAPSVAVHVLDTVAATTGRPNLAATLTLGAWL